LSRALELAPDNVEAVAALAESEEGLGDVAAAETHARRALAQAGGNATANLVVGLLAMKKQQYGEARSAFERVVAADPDSTRAYYQLSLACARLGDDGCAHQSLDLYKQKLRETEERVLQLRTQTGLGRAGVRP
jgi:predicted Zn-dependent protease